MRFRTVENKARLAMVVVVLGLLLIIGVSTGLYLQTRGDMVSLPIAYLTGYLLVAPLLGLALVFVLVRWLLRPYHRMVEAARGSPVRASSAKSESEFVVETFQALVERLQAKEKELEQLHAVERNRAERSERFSERLIANIPSGLVTIDSSGLVTSVNSHARQILGGQQSNAAYGRLASGELMSPSVQYREFFGGSPRMIEMIGECLNRGTLIRRGEVEIVVPGANRWRAVSDERSNRGDRVARADEAARESRESRRDGGWTCARIQKFACDYPRLRSIARRAVESGVTRSRPATHARSDANRGSAVEQARDRLSKLRPASAVERFAHQLTRDRQKRGDGGEASTGRERHDLEARRRVP
jgi:PAS domain-containing protein